VLIVLAAVVGYLLGSFPSGYLIGKAKGVDVRRYGSGATGGTNVLRTLGAGPAIATGLLDVVKGLLGAYAGYLLAGHWGYFVGGFAALAGHSYPVWLNFRGGKSVATGAGALLLFHPWAFVIGVATGLAAIIPTRWVSLGSLVGALFFCGTVWFSPAPLPDKLLAVGAFAVVYVRHWENMKRIAAGTENRFGQSAKPRSEG
jgi:glycerol-3-phosphate acyltransferase PlsY